MFQIVNRVFIFGILEKILSSSLHLSGRRAKDKKSVKNTRDINVQAKSKKKGSFPIKYLQI